MSIKNLLAFEYIFENILIKFNGFISHRAEASRYIMFKTFPSFLNTSMNKGWLAHTASKWKGRYPLTSLDLEQKTPTRSWLEYLDNRLITEASGKVILQFMSAKDLSSRLATLMQFLEVRLQV